MNSGNEPGKFMRKPRQGTKAPRAFFFFVSADPNKQARTHTERRGLTIPYSDRAVFRRTSHKSTGSGYIPVNVESSPSLSARSLFTPPPPFFSTDGGVGQSWRRLGGGEPGAEGHQAHVDGTQAHHQTVQRCARTTSPTHICVMLDARAPRTRTLRSFPS